MTPAPTNEMLALAEEIKLYRSESNDPIYTGPMVANILQHWTDRLSATTSARDVREALLPFAKLGGNLSDSDINAGLLHRAAFFDCPSDVVLYQDNMGACITVDDIRAARRALSNPDAAAPAAGWDAIPSQIIDRYDILCAGFTDQACCQPDHGTSWRHLRWMLSQLRSDIRGDKAHRWLGFIQGVMAERCVISVQEERDFTRPFFAAPPLQAPAHSDAALEEIQRAMGEIIAYTHEKNTKDIAKRCLAALTAPAAKAGDEPTEQEIIDFATKHRDAIFRLQSEFFALATHAISEADVGRKLIEAERARQISEEGWDTSHDDAHDNGELLRAAMCYLCQARLQFNTLRPDGSPLSWPWETRWWKPSTPERNFVKGGALLLAERDRLDRAGRPHSHVDQKIELTVKWLNEVIQSAAQGSGTEGGEA